MAPARVHGLYNGGAITSRPHEVSMSLSKYHWANENTNADLRCIWGAKVTTRSWWALRPWVRTGGHATVSTLGADLASWLGCTAEWKYSTGGNK